MTFVPALPTTRNYVNSHLSQNGAGATFDAAADHSGAEVYWEARPGAGNKWRIFRLIGGATDATQFQIEGFIAGTALTNKIDVEIVRGTGGSPTILQTVVSNIASWADLGQNCYDIDFRQGSGAGQYWAHFRWSFFKGGTTFVLDGDKDDALRIKLHDNFAGLTGLNFHAQGYAM